MDYYNSNAAIDYIRENDIEDFKFVIKNQWQLIYGDHQSAPKLLVAVSGVPSEKELLHPQLMSTETDLWLPLKQLYKRTNIPLILLRFVITKPEVQDVAIVDLKTSKEIRKIALADLPEYFKKYGLPITNNATAKYLNDKTSSFYHKWQRKNLGSTIKVTDIDLIKLDANHKISHIIELKRSKIHIRKWAPYKDDYPNFKLIAKLILNTGIKLEYLYNYHTKKPDYIDDINTVKVFNTPLPSSKFEIKEIGIMSMTEFINYLNK
ncbi:hypothetical protein [Flammeovirga sp. OC4]|uniref:hypothetical protein n=1 Tax=Flammeovirga sp. OC4 TaxID=1382345 RepID=UPI0005C6536E|nr:hypothetical protein [Flammeovirga sp. OC4]